ncbi:sec-independent protein translocase protein TatA [Saccharicrinis carchari]|uniref:Sec-independent protein translocase protein TatA n=1 Tax=Saccharicrinis carchari TaxID=1168039 RepID=A0A521F1S4_SACCC|nr:twin-arginine translocase TatA/TatE family subunit [Saccharicrinis carchari]SMO90129.1 sec-independent protein translocase protein TatA [Saccharicrinis carchari]
MELNSVYICGFMGGYEWILIILVVVLLFGGRKIPELMKGLGQGMKEFKNARNENDKEEDKKTSEEKQ